jgi:hypothetical protein
MKNIHILPTDKPSRLVYLTKKGKEVYKDLRLFDKPMPIILDSENQNIYITNDEEIKEGDWFYSVRELIEKAIINYPKGENFGKIILTSDQELIKDGVQAIDDEFLEWFVKNQSCKFVDVYNDKSVGYDYDHYSIIIPKEAPKKVLTEEDIFSQRDIDAVTNYINKEQQKQHLIDIIQKDEELGLYVEPKQQLAVEWLESKCSEFETIYDSLPTRLYEYVQQAIEMEKQQQGYSEEDVKTAFLDGWQLRDGNLPFPKAKRKWFNEFKNKLINGN